MSLRSLAFLALGLAVGFLAGTQWGGPGAGRTRATPRPQVPEEERVVPATGDSAPAALPGATAPESPEEGEVRPGLGCLTVDCPEDEGYEAWIDTTDFTGRPVRMRSEEYEGACRFDLPAGTYDVEWSDPSGMDHRGTRAIVVAGQETRIASRFGTPAPLSADMGCLQVGVESADGVVDAELDILVDGPGLSPERGAHRVTNAAGWCAFTLVPGPYELRAGEGVRRVEVRAGETTRVVFSHEEEGDLVLPSLPVCRLRLDRRDGRQVWIRRPLVRPGGVHLLFVPAGEYAAWAVLDDTGEDLRELGTVVVEAGRATPFDPRLPPGSIHVQVTPWDRGRPPPRVHLVPAEGVTPVQVVPWKTMKSDAWRVPAPGGEGHLTVLGWSSVFSHLHPGLYRLRVQADGLPDHEQVVELSDDATLAEVRLEPGAGR